MPKRIQLSRKKGWRKPEGAIVVARPSKWGNPYQVERDQVSWVVHDGDWTLADFLTKAAAVEYAVERFREASKFYDVAELAGHDLACWCPLEDAEGRRVPCHADVLLELANGSAP